MQGIEITIAPGKTLGISHLPIGKRPYLWYQVAAVCEPLASFKSERAAEEAAFLLNSIIEKVRNRPR